MRGYKVERRFGWDNPRACPPSSRSSASSASSDKAQIEEMGIGKFKRGLPRVGAQVHQRMARLRPPRQARWVDFDKRLQEHSIRPSWNR